MPLESIQRLKRTDDLGELQRVEEHKEPEDHNIVGKIEYFENLSVLIF
jgi:hypothetical protein